MPEWRQYDAEIRNLMRSFNNQQEGEEAKEGKEGEKEEEKKEEKEEEKEEDEEAKKEPSASKGWIVFYLIYLFVFD